MKKPRKLDDVDWMDNCLTWVNIPERWSSYLGDRAIPRAYENARIRWTEAKAVSDETHTLSAGFKVYALLALTRRLNSYRGAISDNIRFPFTGIDTFALLTQLERDCDSGKEDAADIAEALRGLLEACGGADASDELFHPAVAYCRDFLAWEKSAPRLGANRECGRCGRCCTDLWDAYDFTAAERDVLLWSLCGRWEIIERIDWGAWHCWLDPKSGKTMDRCPWLEKNGRGTSFSCRIDGVKPKHCRVWRGCPIGKPGHSVEKALRNIRRL